MEVEDLQAQAAARRHKARGPRTGRGANTHTPTLPAYVKGSPMSDYTTEGSAPNLHDVTGQFKCV